MLSRMSVLTCFALAGVLTGCLNASDIPSSAPQAAPSAKEADRGPVQISGIDQFHQIVPVVTISCTNVKFETDRRAVADNAIKKALEGQATALPGGVRFEIQSLKLRMRCLVEGPSTLGSYCVADAGLSVVAVGKDRHGQEIRIAASKEVMERSAPFLVCVSTMPTITSAVDKVLAGTLADVQKGLVPATGISAP